MVVMEIPISPLLPRRQSKVSESSGEVFPREKRLFTSFHGGLRGRKNTKVVMCLYTIYVIYFAGILFDENRKRMGL